VKFFKLNSQFQQNVNVADYRLDWSNPPHISKPQTKVMEFLRPYWISHVVLSEFRIPGSRMRCDFVNLTRQIVLEVSPDGSHSFNPFFHKNRFKFGAAMKRDLDKEKWAVKNGFLFIEVLEDDLNNLSPEWFLDKYSVTL
jgi:hypothetical protein